MARCIIHVGMPRTGTKSIQHSLKSLDDAGFYYARFRNQPNHSVGIAAIFADRADERTPRKHGLQGNGNPAGLPEQYRNDLRSSIKAAAGRTLVLSGEGILRMAPPELMRLKAFLARQGFEDVEIIAYVRAPMSYIESAVQQRIKVGNASVLRFAEAMPGYRESFSKFDEIFGAAKVRLFKFDTAAFAGNDVVQDFCGRTGIPLSSIMPVRRNEAIGRVVAQLRFQFIANAKANGHEPMTPAMSLALCNKLKALDPAPFRIAPSILQRHLDDIGDDIAWMEQRLGASLAEDAHDGPGDIASEADLLVPVSGIDERLRDFLRQNGDVSDNSGLDTSALLLRIVGEAKGDARESRAAQARDAAPIAPGGPAGKRRPQLESRPADAARPKRPGEFVSKPMSVDYAMAQEGITARPLVRTPLLAIPAALLNKDKNLVVLWSPKSACTTMYVWFSHISGFSGDVRNYAAWPHKHRMQQFMKSSLYAESARDGMAEARVLRIIRDPYGRAVSIYRHALQTNFADQDMSEFSDNRIDAEVGYSFQTFLDLLSQLNMQRTDIHFRPQFHPYEATRKADRVINISKTDLFTELNRFEEESGLKRTDFADLNWLHTLEHKRKASQEPMQGDALDEVPFSRNMAKEGKFPSYAQLLTPRARQRIEAIYRADFEAYHEFL